MNLSNIPKLKTVVLDDSSDLNHVFPIKGLIFGEIYVILGEVDIAPGHYILACYSKNNSRILPGIYHVNDRFRETTEDDI